MSVDISFFVPCLNEEKNIEATLQTILEATRPFSRRFEILAVDDGSADKTWDILSQKARDPFPIPLRLFQNKRPLGLGYNYFTLGLQAKGNYYMLVNGDNVEPAETIRAILEQMGKADMVIPYFGKLDRRNLARRLISWTFTTIVNGINGRRIRYYNGPVLHKTENVRLYRAETIGFGYQAELVSKLLLSGASCVQVQVPNSDRQWGFSKAFGLSNILSVSNSVFHILLRRLQKTVIRLMERRYRHKT